jgi:hypothetical protein
MNDGGVREILGACVAGQTVLYCVINAMFQGTEKEADLT